MYKLSTSTTEGIATTNSWHGWLLIVVVAIIFLILIIVLIKAIKSWYKHRNERLKNISEKNLAEQNSYVNGSGGSFLANLLDIKFEDTIIRSKDWKAFRRSATQDELLALAIGSKYRMLGISYFVKTIIAIAGMILSIVIGIWGFDYFGMFSLFILIGGYLFFNLLASKLIGYTDTYTSCYRKLSSDRRDFLEDVYQEKMLVKILRFISLWVLNIVTFPYKAILMFIEILIPTTSNWVIAHGGGNGAVITIPKGYDIGNLGALGQYYASATFSQAWEKHLDNVEREKLAKFSTYEYTDKNGMRQVAYSDDGKTFYDSTNKLHEVGTSTDGGKTINLK